MNHRSLVSLTTLSVLIGLTLAAVEAVEVEGQQRPTQVAATDANAYTPPRTPDGQPDLQGYWTNSTYTPLERARGVTKEFYSPEEFAEILRTRATREEAQTEPGTTGDVHYDFTQFGLDHSQSTLSQNLRTSLIVDPPDGHLPPVNEEGKKRAAELQAERRARGGQYDDVKNMPVGSRCIIMGGAGPPLMDAGYNSNYQIVQAPGYVMILTEMIHDARIIPLDDSSTPPDALRQWVGLSRGHWEGDTLVVETTNFNGKRPFRGSSDNMRVIERFRRVADDKIDYRFTVEDKATWDRPWTAELPLVKTNGPIFEFACHETNFGIANILAGARAAEKAEAEGASRN